MHLRLRRGQNSSEFTAELCLAADWVQKHTQLPGAEGRRRSTLHAFLVAGRNFVDPNR